jgi:hypothetical protein
MEWRRLEETLHISTCREMRNLWCSLGYGHIKAEGLRSGGVHRFIADDSNLLPSSILDGYLGNDYIQYFKVVSITSRSTSFWDMAQLTT